MEGVPEERIARNNATFREANERISAAAGSYGIETPIPFICECSDPSCSGIIRLTPEEYEEVRASSRHFVNIPGHEAASMGMAVVVEQRDRYSIVEKIGRAGEIVEGLDERRAVGTPQERPLPSSVETMDERQRRIGLNEAVFREANERIEEINRTFEPLTGELVLVCECGHADCVEKITMTAPAYEALRSEATHFAIVPGHKIADVERLVERHEGYDVIKKDEGVPQRIAEATDPR